MRSNHVKRAFTLIEILIVVVILGILAAIVIPQFTDASTDAQEASVRSQMQTIRGQLELFRVQNGDTYPDLVTNQWADLVGGDYLQAAPRNPLMPAGSQTSVGANVTGGAAWGWDGNDLTANDGADAVFVE
ncbi:MAG: competence type IV pilus major pilin ComGC [Planctomycetota bacterium]|jgi:prepilin-type N-terminal cleavage/methylation domain-containing protein